MRLVFCVHTLAVLSLDLKPLNLEVGLAQSRGEGEGRERWKV